MIGNEFPEQVVNCIWIPRGKESEDVEELYQCLCDGTSARESEIKKRNRPPCPQCKAIAAQIAKDAEALEKR